MAQLQHESTVLRVDAGDINAKFKDVQAAIDAVRAGNKEQVVIEIMPGHYRQPVHIPRTKNFITLRGLGLRAEETVLSWDNTASKLNTPHQVGTGTFASGTVIVDGSDFIAEKISFENSAPKGSGQAVAIRVSGDRCAFYSCRFLGWQDTAYLQKGKQYLKDCYIAGSVDFIFGNAKALLENCQIECKDEGYVTAQARESKDESTGFVFLRCKITGNGKSSYAYLGRPWKPFALVVFAYTWMDACIKPEGWSTWDSQENEGTAYFYEYQCCGPGSATTGRVKWERQLNDGEIEQYANYKFIEPDSEIGWVENTVPKSA